MIRGIAIFGLNGSGKSTLAHALVKQTGYYGIDAEDYYFPEQKKDRLFALEDGACVKNESIEENPLFQGFPFSNPRQKSEVQKAIEFDIKSNPQFIITSVSMNWSEEILSHIDVAFWLQVPREECIRRIMQREEKRFGKRVLAGGDMYEQQKEFRNKVAERSFESVGESAKNLSCPIIVLDGTLSIEENMEKILRYIKEEQ